MAHAVAVLLLEFTMLLIGGAILVLGIMFPKHTEQFDRMQKYDIWSVTALLCMFAGYTISRVFIRLIRGIFEELRG